MLQTSRHELQTVTIEECSSVLGELEEQMTVVDITAPSADPSECGYGRCGRNIWAHYLGGQDCQYPNPVFGGPDIYAKVKYNGTCNLDEALAGINITSFVDHQFTVGGVLRQCQDKVESVEYICLSIDDGGSLQTTSCPDWSAGSAQLVTELASIKLKTKNCNSVFGKLHRHRMTIVDITAPSSNPLECAYGKCGRNVWAHYLGGKDHECQFPNPVFAGPDTYAVVLYHGECKLDKALDGVNVSNFVDDYFTAGGVLRECQDKVKSVKHICLQHISGSIEATTCAGWTGAKPPALAQQAQAQAVRENDDDVTLCNITANNHVEAFRTANATMMSDTYWPDAYMQYGTGSPVSSKAALGSFFGGFFNTMFNADLSGNLELDALITACPPNQKCFTFFSFRVSSCKVIWELNQLTAIYKVDGGKCLIEFETGINYPCTDCVLSKCPS